MRLHREGAETIAQVTYGSPQSSSEGFLTEQQAVQRVIWQHLPAQFDSLVTIATAPALSPPIRRAQVGRAELEAAFGPRPEGLTGDQSARIPIWIILVPLGVLTALLVAAVAIIILVIRRRSRAKQVRSLG